MASSAVKICNEALTLVGAERITSLAEVNKRARILNDIYPNIRDQLLAEHPWNFAIGRTSLAATSTTPDFDYDYQFQLPNDCLRVIKTNLGSEEPWSVEGDKLLANWGTIKIKYIKKVTTEGNFSPGFCSALAHRLSIYLAYNLAQSTTLAKRMTDLYIVISRNAKAQDGQEGSVEKIEANEWLDSRY